MSERVTLRFERDDYASYNDVATTAVNLTQYEAQICASLLSLLLIRNAWGDMTNTQWDAISSSISSAIEEINNAG